MNKELKATAYVVAVVAAVSTFSYYLRPYLLQTPPNALVLACIGATVAIYLYVLIAGPVFISQLGRADRLRAQQFFKAGFWVNLFMAIAGLLSSSVPPLTPATSVCFALACVMLGVFAKYPARKKIKTV